MKISARLCMLLACASAAVPAMAGTVSLHVNSADLNLATPEGVETLRVRVVNAANRLCDKAVLDEYRGGIDKIDCLRSIKVSPGPVAALVNGESGLVQLVRASDRRAERGGLELAGR